MGDSGAIMSRTLFGIGCLVAGAVIAANVTSAQQKAPGQTPDSVDPKMVAFMDCGKLCDDCTRSCELSSSHCVQMIADGNKDCLPIMKACQDCATICSATSRIVTKNGPCTDIICTSCVEACKRCATLCEKSNDPILQKCAQTCRICEKACRDMPKPTRDPSK
jgi:hypothetical protein